MTADPSAPHIGLVVEGPGDANALPVLLRRWLHLKEIYIECLGKPLSCNGRDKALLPGGIEKFVAVAASRPGCVGVLAVLDGEGDDAEELQTELTARAQNAVGVPARICIADKTFEDWIYASVETVFPGSIFMPNRNGQAAIKEALRPRAYAKPVWQPRLTSQIDIELALPRSESLAGLFHALNDLVKIGQDHAK